jgi:predicted dehydrogenase
MPALKDISARVGAIADLNSAAAFHLARKFGVASAVTDYHAILDDLAVNGVFIVVGHNLHAKFVCECLAAGKHTFVEKPLAMNEQEMDLVREAVQKAPKLHLMVGFNRRFSPHIVRVRQLLAGRSEPLAMTMTVNAGCIPPNVWVHDPVLGGGRIIGEGCHFMDLLSFLADSPITAVAAVQMGPGVPVRQDKMSITLGFADGSVGTVNYFANGAKNYPKERLEVFSDNRVLVVDNFRRTYGYGFKGFGSFKTSRQDKGHHAQFAEFIKRVASGGEPLIPFDQLERVTLASLAAVESATTGRMISFPGTEAAPPSTAQSR